MKRISIAERPGWRERAEELGFGFHTMYGEPYWDESRAYVFTLKQIEKDLEGASTELNAMCLEAVDYAVGNEQWLTKLAIPKIYWDWIRSSWRADDPSLYGRFDLAYDGVGPAKMLEFNADTPTALYETGFFQWNWLEDQKARGLVRGDADQFNSVQDKLIARLAKIFEPGCHLHVACCKDTDEDRATVRYIEDCAIQAGLKNHFVHVEDIGIGESGGFADLDGFVIDNLFKLYPFEDLFREAFGPSLVKADMTLLEPPWKAILSNKGLLPLLWYLYPGHPYLLPSYFDGEADADWLNGSYVRKPIFSREGANVEVHVPGMTPMISDGPYGQEGWIVQAFHPVPKFDEDYTVIGSWIIGEEAAGIGIREDRSLITKDLSRFVPHIIED
jgi:glutathionylspermidine synthase